MLAGAGAARRAPANGQARHYHELNNSGSPRVLWVGVNRAGDSLLRVIPFHIVQPQLARARRVDLAQIHACMAQGKTKGRPLDCHLCLEQSAAWEVEAADPFDAVVF